MPSNRRDRDRILRASAVGPDPVADLAVGAVVEGGRWFLGRLLDRRANRLPAADASKLPLAPSGNPTPSNNVKVTTPKQ